MADAFIRQCINPLIYEHNYNCKISPIIITKETFANKGLIYFNIFKKHIKKWGMGMTYKNR